MNFSLPTDCKEQGLDGLLTTLSGSDPRGCERARWLSWRLALPEVRGQVMSLVCLGCILHSESGKTALAPRGSSNIYAQLQRR